MISGLVAVLACFGPSGGGSALAACPAERPERLEPKDLALCASLESDVRKPGAFPLHVYEKKLESYLRAWCHRNPASGWRRDKFVRDTGPFVASEKAGKDGRAFGTHPPVVVWYSKEMIDWLKQARPEGIEAAAVKEAARNEAPIPDGAIMIKEMFPAPAALCAKSDVMRLFPVSGAAVMVRDNKAAHDGWFWGWFGWGRKPTGEPEWESDWPAKTTSPYPNMGFGQYCVNCHASARENQTFATLRNIQGEPGRPLVYFSQNQALEADEPSQHELVTEVATPNPKVDVPGAGARFMEAIGLGAVPLPKLVEVRAMPRSTYDNVWLRPKDSTHSFVTSDQCMGCHDAGGTGLQFDMTERVPGNKLRANLSPYATWRTSPMGMAGRDPIFFAQLASETETLHPKNAALVQDTCLGCHGILGQRAFRADNKRDGQTCETMTRGQIDATPFPDGIDPFAALADYAGLARDGVSCVICHRMAIGPAADKHHGEPQNACLDERRKQLTPGLTKLAATFTGSFDLGPADKLNGPFEKPKELPMKHAIGMAPVYNTDIQSSELCGTCHTVHLPIIRDGAVLGYTYEQTTYAEWAFSAYRTGATPAGGLSHGKGAQAQSCQGCHMPSRDGNGHPLRSKIASIQEYSNFPQTENNLGPEDIDLEVREGFAKHTLVGLNTIFIEMAQQYPDLLGVRVHDPMMPDKSIEPLALTKSAMIAQTKQTADVELTRVGIDKGFLDAEVRVTNHTGHKFPSGVGFRRAFLEFTVRDASGAIIWASGRTNQAGVILDRERGRPLDGEFWWTPDCSAHLSVDGQRYQPHHQVIGREDEVQIYEDIAAKPSPSAQRCEATDTTRTGELTTSFLSRCAKVKDNRILPAGFLDEEKRKRIAKDLGAEEDLAIEAGAHAVDGDKDYLEGGSDSLRYHVPLVGLRQPATVEATLYYQPTPPYYLQDRACTSKSADTKRLMYIAANLDLEKGPTASWKLRVAGSGLRAVGR